MCILNEYDKFGNVIYSTNKINVFSVNHFLNMKNGLNKFTNLKYIHFKNQKIIIFYIFLNLIAYDKITS